MAVYLIIYIQRGNGTDTAFHRTYSCYVKKTYKFIRLCKGDQCRIKVGAIDAAALGPYVK